MLEWCVKAAYEPERAARYGVRLLGAFSTFARISSMTLSVSDPIEAGPQDLAHDVEDDLDLLGLFHQASSSAISGRRERRVNRSGLHPNLVHIGLRGPAPGLTG